MKKIWTPYIKNFPAFSFEFSFEIKKENFQKKILDFDEIFLKSGLRYGICQFSGLDNEKLIDAYLLSRRQKFNKKSDDNYALRFYDLKQWGGYEENIKPFPMIPELSSNMEFQYLPYETTGYINQLLKFETTDAGEIYKADLFDYDFEDYYIYLGVSSDSNIWWEDVMFTTIGEESRGFNPLKDNRPWAYRITPRFNSFLRDIKEVTNDLDGNMLLEEYNGKYVTENGILLDNRIIYQEDIEAGYVDMETFEWKF